MLSTEILLFLFTVIVTYTCLRISKLRKYKHLKEIQKTIIDSCKLDFLLCDPGSLPPFTDRIITIPTLLPEATFNKLKDSALRQLDTERSYFPGHKKGGTVSYEELHSTASEIIAFYHSRYMQRLCSLIVGEPVMPTPINDQSSCSLLFYDKPKDHIGWHYDYNFYSGRHFTVLLPLVNQHRTEKRLSSANLVIRRNGQEITLSTPPNTLILFEGARVYHKVTPLAEDEIRIILSMTYCTEPKSSVLKGSLRRIKDMAYFGIRALWT